MHRKSASGLDLCPASNSRLQAMRDDPRYWRCLADAVLGGRIDDVLEDLMLIYATAPPSAKADLRSSLEETAIKFLTEEERCSANREFTRTLKRLRELDDYLQEVTTSEAPPCAR